MLPTFAHTGTDVLLGATVPICLVKSDEYKQYLSNSWFSIQTLQACVFILKYIHTQNKPLYRPCPSKSIANGPLSLALLALSQHDCWHHSFHSDPSFPFFPLFFSVYYETSCMKTSSSDQQLKVARELRDKSASLNFSWGPVRLCKSNFLFYCMCSAWRIQSQSKPSNIQ